MDPTSYTALSQPIPPPYPHPTHPLPLRYPPSPSVALRCSFHPLLLSFIPCIGPNLTLPLSFIPCIGPKLAKKNYQLRDRSNCGLTAARFDSCMQS